MIDDGDLDGPHSGEVWLIGAGPGHPRLLTIMAWDALHRADVIVHDALIDPRLLHQLPSGTERIFVGKRSGCRSPKQHEVSDLLIQLARQGSAVARLKGGDPLVFGRGGEEITALRSAGIPFRVVPGISAANGSLSWIGVPLTDRMINSSVTFVSTYSAHNQRGLNEDSDWNAIAKASAVLVFYMARQNLSWIAQRLIENGRPPEEDALVIASATTQKQQIQRCTLSNAGSIRLSKELAVLFVVGKVCRYYCDDQQHQEVSDILNVVHSLL